MSKKSKARLTSANDKALQSTTSDSTLFCKATPELVSRSKHLCLALTLSLTCNILPGKTTVARHYAKFLESVGTLPGTLFIETTGSRLANDGIPGIKKELEKIRMAEQFASGGKNKGVSGGMQATVSEGGKLVWE